MLDDHFFQRVYEVVRLIPPGQVATYGQIAAIVSGPRAARSVGWALNGLPQGSDVPWQRVVNASGGCSTDRLPDFPKGLQRSLLEGEGVAFRVAEDRREAVAEFVTRANYGMRIGNFEMDSEDRFSFILSGSQRLALKLKQPQNEAFRQRIVFSHSLRSFSIDDARNYIRFHMERSEGPKELFSDEAIQLSFQMATGLPRVINQIALQAIIRAAVRQVDRIDESFLKQQVLNDSLFDNKLQD